MSAVDPHGLQPSLAIGEPSTSRRSRRVRTLRGALQNRISIVGIVLLSLIFAAVAVGPFIWTLDPAAQSLDDALATTSSAHPLGTDTNGRDVLARLLAGGRLSLAIAIGSVVVATLVGGLIGLVSGFVLGVADAVLMRVMDVVLAFPPLLLALAIVAAAGPGPVNTAIAVAVPAVPVFARLTRSKVISIRERDYVLAARASGVRPWRIMTTHVLGNSVSPVIVSMALSVGLALLEVAGLGFLGLGVQPPDAEWGAMLSDARTYLLTNPVVLIAPGIAIALTAVAINLVGDALRDAIDPAG